MSSGECSLSTYECLCLFLSPFSIRSGFLLVLHPLCSAWRLLKFPSGFGWREEVRSCFFGFLTFFLWTVFGSCHTEFSRAIFFGFEAFCGQRVAPSPLTWLFFVELLIFGWPTVLTLSLLLFAPAYSSFKEGGSSIALLYLSLRHKILPLFSLPVAAWISSFFGQINSCFFKTSW